MAKEKKQKAVKDVLNDLAKERKESGCTLSDADFALIVKVVQKCAG